MVWHGRTEIMLWGFMTSYGYTGVRGRWSKLRWSAAVKGLETPQCTVIKRTGRARLASWLSRAVTVNAARKCLDIL